MAKPATKPERTAAAKAVPEGASKPPPSQEAGLDAWRSFLRAHARLLGELDEELRTQHGVAIGDYDVLIALADAPGGRLRMYELASAVLLSPSGLSRRVERLERDGLVSRRRATTDARSIEAGLTAAGKRLLGRARRAHRASIRERFVDHFDAGELELLHEFMGRLVDAQRSDLDA